MTVKHDRTKPGRTEEKTEKVIVVGLLMISAKLFSYSSRHYSLSFFSGKTFSQRKLSVNLVAAESKSKHNFL